MRLGGYVRRYSGYCAWRGVVTDGEAPEAARAARQAYPELGTAIYFDIAQRTHGVLYELPGQRLNWLWCTQARPTPVANACFQFCSHLAVRQCIKRHCWSKHMSTTTRDVQKGGGFCYLAQVCQSARAPSVGPLGHGEG